MSIGTSMNDGNGKAIRTLVIVLGIVVYLMMLLYSGVHNISLMLRGVDPQWQAVAIAGVIALEVSAASLPLALHFWCHDPMHRIAAFAFYGVDLLLILMNVILDYSITSGEPLSTWMTLYLTYGVPATPVIAGLGWSLLFLLDPSQKERASFEKLRAATRNTLMQKIMEEANKTDVSDQVQAYANIITRNFIGNSLDETSARHGQRQLPQHSTIVEPDDVEIVKPKNGVVVHKNGHRSANPTIGLHRK